MSRARGRISGAACGALALPLLLATEESRSHDKLHVVNWARMVRKNPHWLADDGVHVSADGYRSRAHAIARAVRRCR